MILQMLQPLGRRQRQHPSNERKINPVLAVFRLRILVSFSHVLLPVYGGSAIQHDEI